MYRKNHTLEEEGKTNVKLDRMMKHKGRLNAGLKIVPKLS
jgi:hypothetical protein